MKSTKLYTIATITIIIAAIVLLLDVAIDIIQIFHDGNLKNVHITPLIAFFPILMYFVVLRKKKAASKEQSA